MEPSQYPATYTEHTWSIKDLLYGIKSAKANYLVCPLSSGVYPVLEYTRSHNGILGSQSL